MACREHTDFQVMSYAVPERCIVKYYPERNVLIPLEHYAKESKVPASKSIPIRIALQQRGAEGG